MLVFKQGITNCVKKSAVLCALSPVITACVFSTVVWILSKFQWKSVGEFLLVAGIFLVPLTPVMIFGALTTLEWFWVYEDRIEAHGVWGCKNTVFYKDVEYVEERMLPLNIRDHVMLHYIFHDGRKNSGGILEHISSPNKRKYTLRIYRTPELEDYILNTLHLEIRKTKTQWDALSE